MIKHCDLQQFRPTVTADPKLINHYISSAPYYGDALIKRDLVQQKRTLSGLRKVYVQSDVLDTKSTNSLGEAIRVLELQIQKLQLACEWANELKAHCELDKQRKAGSDSLLFQATRWGSNKSAMTFELDLVRELTTRSGLADFCSWLHSKNLLPGVPASQFFGPFKTCASGQYDDQMLVCELMDLQYKCSAMTRGPIDSSYVFGWLDYTGYLQFRQDQQTDVKAILMSIASK